MNATSSRIHGLHKVYLRQHLFISPNSRSSLFIQSVPRSLSPHSTIFHRLFLNTQRPISRCPSSRRLSLYVVLCQTSCSTLPARSPDTLQPSPVIVVACFVLSVLYFAPVRTRSHSCPLSMNRPQQSFRLSPHGVVIIMSK
ncbi:hypothetical protein PENSPDRAFT_374638 [Peniophora sp. CONT]|nr:hypothetical protein PENSPDRAFT_374638 [Peniophora sp. CONT]